MDGVHQRPSCPADLADGLPFGERHRDRVEDIGDAVPNRGSVHLRVGREDTVGESVARDVEEPRQIVAHRRIRQGCLGVSEDAESEGAAADFAVEALVGVVLGFSSDGGSSTAPTLSRLGCAAK